MATSNILDAYTASAALTITVASLASSTTGVGRQCTLVSNASPGYPKIKIYLQIKLGTSPSAGNIYVYGIRGDSNGYRTDGAGAADAGLTFLNASVIGVMRSKSAPSSGDVLYGEFELMTPGPEWGMGISHDTGVNLDATAGNHFVHWIGVNPQSQ